MQTYGQKQRTGVSDTGAERETKERTRKDTEGNELTRDFGAAKLISQGHC